MSTPAKRAKLPKPDFEPEFLSRFHSFVESEFPGLSR